MDLDVDKNAPQSVAKSSDDASPNPSLFMRLPLELRRKIYKELLKAGLYVVLSPMYNQNGWQTYQNSSFCKIRFEHARLRKPLFPAILCVNHQIHEEATDVLYRENFFMLHYDTGIKNGQPLRSKLPHYFDKIKNVWISVEDMEDLVAEDFPQSLQTMRVFSSMDSMHKRHLSYVLRLLPALVKAGLQMVQFDEQYKPLGDFKKLITLIMEKGEEETHRILKEQRMEKLGIFNRHMARTRLSK
ncbi:hypothetical protein BU16DRAFT_540312 [Lophium mytilinum]|uniref:DUF7730 domain-containing protein n=1 Tax=Lophium mytilinum TaxID=390894 RepID=A0A6A6QNP6_9PEZI|nr:hypothetical protein BU16DRAFT_540312 [Lophium mytilinum]